MDNLSAVDRSRVMAAIRSSGNLQTELKLAKLFKTHGITGWRRNQCLVGKPDFLFPKERVAVFIDGCFWHGCRWHCRMPKSRDDYWRPKIAMNRRRDLEVTRILRRRGWFVLRIWEHSLKKPTLTLQRLQGILAYRK